MPVPETMCALVKARPEPGALELREVPVPSVGPDDVLIRVAAAGICGTDLHVKRWDPWAQSVGMQPPTVLGHEFAGHVAEVGPAVQDLAPGDVVAGESHIPCGRCYHCLSQKPQRCAVGGLVGLTAPGGLAQFVALPQRAVARIQPGISVEAAATIEPMGGPYRAAAALEPAGSVVLLTGCGPTGLFGVGWLRVLGAAHVVASDVSPQRRQLAIAMGADEALDPTRDDLPARVDALTHGLGVDAFVDFSGSAQAIEQALPLVRRGGRVSLFGLPSRAVSFDLPRDVIFKELTIQGIVGREMFATWFTLQALLAAGRFRPDAVITHRLPLADFEQAFALAEDARAGKVLLCP